MRIPRPSLAWSEVPARAIPSSSMRRTDVDQVIALPRRGSNSNRPGRCRMVSGDSKLRPEPPPNARTRSLPAPMRTEGLFLAMRTRITGCRDIGRSDGKVGALAPHPGSANSAASNAAKKSGSEPSSIPSPSRPVRDAQFIDHTGIRSIQTCLYPVFGLKDARDLIVVPGTSADRVVGNCVGVGVGVRVDGNFAQIRPEGESCRPHRGQADLATV